MSDGPTPALLAEERAAIAMAQGLDRALMYAAATFCSQPSPIGAVSTTRCHRVELHMHLEDWWRQHRPRTHR